MTELEKQEILKIWPDAVWFPGDPVPVGERVRTCGNEHGHSGYVGTVIGEHVPLPSAGHCRTCTCPSEAMRRWWLVRLDGWRRVGGFAEGFERTGEQVPEEKAAVSFQWPPSLRRLER